MKVLHSLDSYIYTFHPSAQVKFIPSLNVASFVFHSKVASKGQIRGPFLLIYFGSDLQDNFFMQKGIREEIHNEPYRARIPEAQVWSCYKEFAARICPERLALDQSEKRPLEALGLLSWNTIPTAWAFLWNKFNYGGEHELLQTERDFSKSLILSPV